MHPINEREICWGAVEGSFEQFARISTKGEIDV
jgi:hypothetical protein